MINFGSTYQKPKGKVNCRKYNLGKYRKTSLYEHEVLKSGAIVVRDITTNHRKVKNLWRR